MANSENSTATNDQLFAGKNLICKNLSFKAYLSSKPRYGSNLFEGVWKEKEVVVRRIQKTECHSQWEKMVARHEKGILNHENVLKILGFEEDTEWRYFSLEQFHLTLEENCFYSSGGGLLSDALILLQMASGINYIHSKGLAHGNLNPNTVLLADSIPRRVKISEFGLTNSIDCSSATDSVESDDLADEPSDKNKRVHRHQQFLELSHPKYWKRTSTSAATHDGSIPVATVHGDVFAAGCLFFYLLTQGSHPFGSPKQILANISESRPINLKKLKSKHFAYESIKNMIGKPPTDGTQFLIIAASEFAEILPLNIDENKKLGKGAFGVVFEGTYEGKRVAIKRIPVEGEDRESKAREINEAVIPMELNHENVMKLLHVDYQTDERYLFLVLELCAGTLEDCVKKGKQGFNLPGDEKVLYQIANGLDYIHATNLVHRDIKPENILISLTSPAQMKISDFGFCKKVNVRGSFSQSALKGTLNWMAPEMLMILNEADDNEQDTLPRGTIQSDTYSAGCVFFHFLTNGSHPFGINTSTIPSNVLKNNPKILIAAEKLPKDHFAYNLIEKMIKRLPERIMLPEVMKQLHPLLSASKRTGKFRLAQKTLTRADMIDFVHSTIITRFHPIEPVLACGSRRVRILKAANLFIPFLNWKIEIELSARDQNLSICSLEWSSDGTQLAAGYDHGVTMVWGYPSGETLVEMKHSSRITDIAWNPVNNDMLVIIENNTGLSVWDLTTMRPKPNEGDGKIIRVPLFKYNVTWMVKWVSENHIAFPRHADVVVVKLYENIQAKIVSNRIEKCFSHEGRAFIQWNQVRRLLVSCPYWGNLIKVWSMDMCEGDVWVEHPLHMLEVPSGCNCLAMRPTRDLDSQAQTTTKSKKSIIIACGLNNGDIMIWNPLEKSNNRVLNRHSHGIYSLAFSSDGQLLASTDESTITIWCAKTWKPVFFTKTSYTATNLSWFTAKSSGGITALLTYTTRFENIKVIERW